MWRKPLVLPIRSQKLRKFVTCLRSQNWHWNSELWFLSALHPSAVPVACSMSLSLRINVHVSTQSGGGNLPASKSEREGYHGFTSALAGILIFCFSFWLKYLQLRNISIGNHAYESKGTEQSGMAICQHFYKQGNICPGNDTFDIDPKIETGNVLL